MAFQTPILITNFKCYQESTGARAVELAKLHERVANELGVNVAVVGMPDRVMGEKACAYVALQGGQSLTFEEMVDFLKQKSIAMGMIIACFYCCSLALVYLMPYYLDIL